MAPSSGRWLELARQRIHPDDLELFEEKAHRAPQEEKDFELEHRLLMPGGAVKHVNVVARATRDGSGKVEFVGAVMDVTERKRAAEALRASEHLARGQLDALTHTLDSLAQESDPDKLLEQVLRTIVEQSDAHSVSVWERDDAGGWLGSKPERTRSIPRRDSRFLPKIIRCGARFFARASMQFWRTLIRRRLVCGLDQIRMQFGTE